MRDALMKEGIMKVNEDGQRQGKRTTGELPNEKKEMT